MVQWIKAIMRIYIAFNTNDLSVAFNKKKVIGHGTITHSKNSFFSIYTCYSPLAGCLIVADLISNMYFEAFN
jgi:hypothetical protein